MITFKQGTNMQQVAVGFIGVFLAFAEVTACTVQVKGSADRSISTDAALLAWDVPGTQGQDSGAKAASTCQPRRIRAVTTSYFEEAHTTPPECTIDDQGVLTMSYNYPTNQGWCPQYKEADGSRSGPYRACFFGQNEDVSDFQRGLGLLEAHFCFEGPLYEDLNLWFNTQAEPGTPLSIIPLHAADDATPGSCQTAILSLSDSCTTYGKTQCGRACSVGQSADAGTLEAGQSLGADDGGVEVTSTASCSDFNRVKIRLTTEYCKSCMSGDTCVRPQNVSIRLLSLVYYPQECLCDTDSDCAMERFCRKDGLSPQAACWTSPSGCRGICSP